MSLQDLGVFAPLEKDHPLITGKKRCWKCKMYFGIGTRPALNPVETPAETGSSTVRAEAVCATCYLKGQEVMTPKGSRIVLRVKEGNGSPFPVIMTNQEQYKDEEVWPLLAVREQEGQDYND